MHVGAYAEAGALSKGLMAEGPNEWRDVFLEAILYELVDELGLKQQRRRQRRHGEYSIRVTRKAARAHGDASASGMRSTDSMGRARPQHRQTVQIHVNLGHRLLGDSVPHGWP